MLTAQSGNTGGLTWVAAPSGGLSNSQQWRTSANQTGMSNNTVITNNWEEVDTNGYGRIGNAMTQSSGIFTFPATGYWLIDFRLLGLSSDVQDYLGAKMEITQNNSSYSQASEGYSNTDNNQWITVNLSFQLDVTNLSNQKVKFSIVAQNNGNVTAAGNTSYSFTSATFTRLGDT